MKLFKPQIVFNLYIQNKHEKTFLWSHPSALELTRALLKEKNDKYFISSDITVDTPYLK